MSTDAPTPTLDDVRLSAAEQRQLVTCEATIRNGFRTFLAMGRAFAAIRTQRLYRATYHDFASYITERWPQFDGRRQVDRLIAAAEVQQDLDLLGVVLTRESQARPLVSLDGATRRAAVQRALVATGGAPPTAQQLTHAVACVRAEPVLTPPKDRRCRHCDQADADLAAARLTVVALQAEVAALKAQITGQAARLPADDPTWRCMRCGQPDGMPFARSVADPLRCLRCARTAPVAYVTNHTEVLA